MPRTLSKSFVVVCLWPFSAPFCAAVTGFLSNITTLPQVNDVRKAPPVARTAYFRRGKCAPFPRPRRMLAPNRPHPCVARPSFHRVRAISRSGTKPRTCCGCAGCPARRKRLFSTRAYRTAKDGAGCPALKPLLFLRISTGEERWGELLKVCSHSDHFHTAHSRELLGPPRARERLLIWAPGELARRRRVPAVLWTKI